MPRTKFLNPLTKREKKNKVRECRATPPCLALFPVFLCTADTYPSVEGMGIGKCVWVNGTGLSGEPADRFALPSPRTVRTLFLANR